MAIFYECAMPNAGCVVVAHDARLLCPALPSVNIYVIFDLLQAAYQQSKGEQSMLYVIDHIILHSAHVLKETWNQASDQ